MVLYLGWLTPAPGDSGYAAEGTQQVYQECAMLRISDLLQLRISHFIDEHKRIRQRFWIKEQKRNKRHEVVINQSIREALDEYLEAYHGVTDDPENFVFFNTKTNGYSEPIKRGQAWKLIVSICNVVGLRGNYGTHSLRKTWGFHARMQGVDLALVMHKFNHESARLWLPD